MELTGRCANCIFWREQDIDREGTNLATGEWGDCANTTNDWYGWTVGSSGQTSPIPLTEPRLAIARAEYSYDSILQTHRDHGCVLFQSREP